MRIVVLPSDLLIQGLSRKLVLGLCCFLVSFVAIPSLVFADGTISGVVRNQATGNVISGATLVLIRPNGTHILQTTTSAANGTYSFTASNPGNYTVRASFAGLQTKLVGAKVLNNQNTVVNLSLSSNPGILAGKVVNAVTSAAVAGAAVEVFQNGIVVGEAITNALGDYTLSGLFQGSFTVTANAAGFSSVTLGAIVVNGATTTLNISLPINPGTISGTVTNLSTSLPIANATVKLTQNGTLIGNAQTNASGNYSISGVPQGSYTIQAEATDFATSVQGVIVQAGLTSTVNFSLAVGTGAIIGTITHATTGEPLVSATIKVSSKRYASFVDTYR